MDRRIKKTSAILFTVLFVLSIVDYCLTVEGISSGVLVEVNPVMAFILEHTNFWMGLLIKQAMIVPIGIVIYPAQRFGWVLWPCVALYVGVAVK